MTKKMTKIITLILVMTFMVSIFPAFPVVNAATVYKTDTVIECEDVELGKDVGDVKDKEASGNKHVLIGGIKVDDPLTIKSPDMELEFEVPADGKYIVYIKSLIEGGGNDSYFYKFDKEDWQVVHPGERPSWVWVKSAEKELTKGKHTFSWNHRELGAKLDCIFITTDSAKLPLDIAPLEAIAAAPAPSQAPSSPSTVTDYTLKTVNIKGGSAFVEAEDYIVGKTVSEYKSSTASGKKAAGLNVDDRKLPVVGQEPGIGFDIVVEKDGTYNIWARHVTQGGGQDSCWTNKNNWGYADTGFSATSKDAEDYVWTSLSKVSITGQKGRFELIPRETGTLIDKFLITSNIMYIPEGEGELPPEVGNDVLEFPKNVYAMPSITPPPEHPRVLVRAKDLDKIRENMKHPENAKAVEKAVL